ncbi:4-amino-4-deoxy-L-arabinose transferase-like glycosyltransferase [Sphingobium wenxiniae]|uniref:4-amino-4-deoxy-L-arabinose transferase-like glycosyltransferase n=1 Tax=Sphingobium wenxiniae (strain DSM 21828 / CGMCC 1.7748 / JZ-1) TaxID=595605 RepID=A0A562KPV3_SPHWJ|nr:glycosyltransferase family 39 protein [Sphingobium wenxiniae]MBB6190226.1 4-amino-4-deoxy-L-arabinose transferase-like glycosyltransferase [Sphingobium wenxiniae]TWH97459.1 4-amino-4-deoxy-L-arabinose transferase-like glycosyltransferase [Sphingobium wenxiniae]
MYRKIVLAPPRGRAAPVAIALALCVPLLLWCVLTALATPFDHDESQYIAGAYFSSHMLVFRDFLYLQPPLHSWFLAPLAGLFPRDMVLAMRLATAATAFGVLLTLWKAQRIAGISRDSAAIATLLAGSTAAFQFTGSVVRNDMLATLLASLAMLMLLSALRSRRAEHWLLGGLLLGLATATKLNFAPLALASGLFALHPGGRAGWKAAAWLSLGGLAGLSPMLLLYLVAPEPFTYGVLTFGATAPHSWYAANGAEHELLFLEKLADLLKFLWKGPALIALLLIGSRWIFDRNRTASAGRTLCRWMIGGGLLGAALPTPLQVQYLMPLIPPLALGMGYLLDDARRWPFAAREMLLGLLCLAAVPGLLKASGHIAVMARTGSPVLEAGSQAVWIGTTVRALARDDGIVTLSPHLAVDSGLQVDPRFATGPFVYRSGSMITSAQARRMHVVTPATLADLDRDPPAAILAGYEGGTRKLPLAPDAGLLRYAASRRYRGIVLPDGVGRLFVRLSPLRPGRRIMR